MNLKTIVITSLLLTNAAHAKGNKKSPIFEKSDFTHAEEINKNGQSVLSVDLTPEGLEKIASLNKNGVGKKIPFKINDKIFRFKLKEAIKGDQMIIGPFSFSEAKKIEKVINET